MSPPEPSSSPTPPKSAPATGGATSPAAEPTPGPVTPPTQVASNQRDASVRTTFGLWSPESSELLVGGYVEGVVESGGTCTLTVTRGAVGVSAAAEAIPDASTTSCGTLSIAGTALGSGSWTAVLNYESAKFSGTAAPMPIEVP
jgi:hypothetical protein